MELSWEDNQRLQHFEYFRKKVTPQMFHQIPNVPPIEVQMEQTTIKELYFY